MAIRHRNEHNIAVMMSFIPANAALLADVVQAVADVPQGLGVFYWEPAWLPVPGDHLHDGTEQATLSAKSALSPH